MKVLVKVCGITNAEDARAACEAGADALGFNFYPQSPRYIAPEDARKIVDEIAGFDVLRVGVFVNEETPEAVAQLALISGVNAIQLHGDESPEFCRAVRELISAKIIKAFRARSDLTLDEMARYEVDALMIDAYAPGAFGGTGHVCDWTFARRTAKCFPRLFLAGGLTPDNIVAAIETVKPYGVDVASGVESSPRRKDADKMRAFLDSIRQLK
ncbi:MAG: phosphoribosylanthranilate isomerase [Pyrinomonadaceae bacterium]